MKEIASLKEYIIHATNYNDAAIKRWEGILESSIKELKDYGVDINN